MFVMLCIHAKLALPKNFYLTQAQRIVVLGVWPIMTACGTKVRSPLISSHDSKD